MAWVHMLSGISYVIFVFRGFSRRATGQIKTPEPCKIEYVWGNNFREPDHASSFSPSRRM